MTVGPAFRFAIAAVLALLAAAAGAAAPGGPGGSHGGVPSGATGANAPVEEAPESVTCPSALPSSVRCLGGRDTAGAFYRIAIPADWNGMLVVHAHGGPFLGQPTDRRVDDDLSRWAIVPKAGYAWAGTSFHQGGVAVRSAAEDLERLRDIFLRFVAQPRRIFLHGQSWGAGVAAKAAESRGAARRWDGVLLTSGVLAGGTHAYDFRLDLRVVYEYLCGNHPRASEYAYPMWMGLPENNPMTPTELARRADECLGVLQPPNARTPEQARRLRTIVDVIRIPESSVLGHLNWATFHFQDIARRMGWRDVFGNIGARYSGSADDAALNAGVARYVPDPQAVRQFGEDADLSGRIPMPVITMHAIHDPTAFVEMEHSFAQTMAAAGHARNLVQAFTDDSVHGYVSDASYAALLEALRAWVVDGRKPTPTSIAEGCLALQPRFPSTCRFVPDYRPAPLDSRVPARMRP